MKVTKVIKLRLYTDENQNKLLLEICNEYKRVCNIISGYIFNNNFILSPKKLHSALYYDLRNQSKLSGHMIQDACRTCVAGYKTVKEQLKQNPYKYKDLDGEWKYIFKNLEWLRKPIKFKRPQADYVRKESYSFVDKGTKLSLFTLQGRIQAGYEHNHFKEYFDSKRYHFGTAKLVGLNGIWYFHIPVTYETEEFTKEKAKHVVGIDRGLKFLATIYDETGKTMFFNGKEILRRKKKLKQVREQLKSKHTWSAYRRLKKIEKRENRWMSNINHIISKTLVEYFGENTLFVIEDLTGVSFDGNNINNNKDTVTWAFYQFEQFLIYKAHQNKSGVLKVSAKYTSQRCPKCGRINKNNRNHKLHLYKCDCCGYKSNDDRIGAMNIQNLGTWWLSGIKNPKYELAKK